VLNTVQRFHRLFYDNSARTWSNTTWLGVNVAKCPLDLWIYQELLTRIRPALVVESGTFLGGSAFFLASCMDPLGTGAVLTIDVAAHPGRPEHPRITYVTGSSLDPEVLAGARAAAADASPVLVILDSAHDRDHVLAELRAYAPLVTPGSYLIVEDTNLNGHPVLDDWGAGPYEAVEEFLAENSSFVRDVDCEKYYLTFNPGGYLRRDG
jgi:cephalosporin hydroxylase